VTELVVGLLSIPAPVAGEMVHEAGSTPLFAGSKFTMAVISDIPPAPTGFTDAESKIWMAAKSSVKEADCVASATEVAVIVTITSLAGGVLGAVYVVGIPLAVEVGETVPHGVGEHDTLHVTPLLEESLTT
jgi:hypothetical protein